MRTMVPRAGVDPERIGLASVPRGDRLPVAVVAAGIVLLPLLRPKGPGHTAPEDLLMAVAVMTTLLWAGATRARLHLPYAGPIAIFVVAGCAAALLGVAPGVGLVAVAQDVFLLAWCAAVMSACRKPASLVVVLRAWSWSAVGWAVFLLAAVITHHHALAGMNNPEGRAELMFDHPNMAANYFFVSLFVLALARCPRHRLGRAAAYLVLVAAMVMAGSNTALLGLPVAVGASVYMVVRRYSDSVGALAVVMVLLLVGGAGAIVVQQRLFDTVHRSDNPLVRYSVARTAKSANARSQLFAEEYELFKTGPVLGRGPASTKLALGSTGAVTTKEAHDDYLATLVERGPLGALGLMLLIGAVFVRAAGIDSRRLSAEFRAVVPSTAAMIGGLVAVLVSALTHEVLHYRHLWALLGILAAIHLFGRREQSSWTPAMDVVS